MLITLRITNWKAHNQNRKDVFKNSWFKLSNSFFDSPSIANLTNDQIVTWIYLLTIRGKSKTDDFEINSTSASFLCKCSEGSLLETMGILQHLGMIDIDQDTTRARNAHVTSTLTQIKIKIENKNNIYTPEFETINHQCNEVEIKKEKKKRIYKPSNQGFEGSHLEVNWLELGKSWLEFAALKSPSGSKNKKWTAESFGLELRRVSKLTSIPIEKLSALLEFAKNDDFWSKNLVSPFGLATKKNNGNRKVENAILSMDGNKTKITKPRKMIVGGEY